MSTGYERRVKRLREQVLKGIAEAEADRTADLENSEENEAPKGATKEENTSPDVIPYDEITRDGISEILTERGIEHNPKGKKEDLYSLLVEGD